MKIYGKMNCAMCNEEVDRRHRNQKYCIICSYKRKEYPSNQPHPLEAKKCLNCDLEFVPSVVNQKMCTPKCRIENLNKNRDSFLKEKKEVVKVKNYRTQRQIRNLIRGAFL